MINLKDFQNQLELVKNDYNLIDESVNKFLENNPFICDSDGVANDWLLNIIVHSLGNLFYAVNPDIPKTEMENLIDYYVWENNFGGTIEKFDLKNSADLYQYIKSLKSNYMNT